MDFGRSGRISLNLARPFAAETAGRRAREHPRFSIISRRYFCAVDRRIAGGGGARIPPFQTK